RSWPERRSRRTGHPSAPVSILVSTPRAAPAPPGEDDQAAAGAHALVDNAAVTNSAGGEERATHFVDFLPKCPTRVASWEGPRAPRHLEHRTGPAGADLASVEGPSCVSPVTWPMPSATGSSVNGSTRRSSLLCPS